MRGFRSVDDIIRAAEAYAGGGGVFSSQRWELFKPDLRALMQTTFSGSLGSTTYHIIVDCIGMPFGTGSIPVTRWSPLTPYLGPPLPDVRPPTPPYVVIK